MRRPLAIAVGLMTLMALPAPALGGRELRVRKSVTALNETERARFVAAVVALKEAPSPVYDGISWYDQFVAWHLVLSACDPTDPFTENQMRGHGGPTFLPWHRQFVLEFENALREVSGRPVTVPYWDWTDRTSVRSVFAEDFMGGDGDPARGYDVTTGPFKDWKITVPAAAQGGAFWASSASREITRHLEAWDGTGLPTREEVQHTLERPLYDAAPFDDRSDPEISFRNDLEGWRHHGEPKSTMLCGPDGWSIPAPHGGLPLHNGVHTWVGGVVATPTNPKALGTMSLPPASVNDPVFFLHHANIDRIWALWQDRHPQAPYVPDKGPNGSQAPMAPWETTPLDVQDIALLGYTYAPARRTPARGASQRGGRPLAVPRLRCLLKRDRSRFRGAVRGHDSQAAGRVPR